MKRLSLYLFLILFTLQTPSLADDIRDFQIEGISVGDSLLDYMSEEEIKIQLERNKPAYNYLTDEFGEAYLFSKFETYDRLAFKVKPNDNNYIIYSIKGSISYDDKLEQCFAKQKEIVKEFSLLYKNARKVEKTFEFPWDPTGKSKTYSIHFIFDSGDEIKVACTQYEKSLKIKNNWADSLQIVIANKEVIAWMRKHIN